MKEIRGVWDCRSHDRDGKLVEIIVMDGKNELYLRYTGAYHTQTAVLTIDQAKCVVRALRSAISRSTKQ